ncbi:carboxymuconolactone decarboxylase family protein [Nocardioides humi]|uniref:carboxymuconolactone decarboxylase family protein n=1 Tax=Nocardioides humi TaxID=449461 RepID=UPI001C63F5A6|nr:carboxymuconolactone decarboxylase family protein [Nocardioides humi]
MDDRYERGRVRRKEVLGDAYVEEVLAAATPFTRDLQEYVTRACWGDIWSRPGLLRRERSILNIGMLVALGRAAELRLHLRAALSGGVTVREIRELLLQSAFYCGGPAALDAFRVASDVLDELGLDQAEADTTCRHLVHQAAFAWAEHAPSDISEKVRSALDDLRPHLCGVHLLTYGPDLGLNEETADFAVFGLFADEPAYRAYADHPDHRSILHDLVLPNATSRTVIQYQV